MLLLLDELRVQARDFDHAESLADLLDDDGRSLVPQPVRLRGRAGPGARGVELRARLEAGLSLLCSRCLEPCASRLGVEIELTLVDEAAEFAGPDAELRPEDASVYYAREGRADLGAIAREQIHLHLPLKPVCRAECRGLCPSCGGNRNRIECGCRPTGIDPRLAPLERLRDPKGRSRGK